MLFEEWNMDDALKVAHKEAREEGIDIGVKQGRKEGREEGRCDLIKTMLESLSIEEVSNILKMPIAEIKRTLQLV